jgi:CHAD domain-containing protein
MLPVHLDKWVQDVSPDDCVSEVALRTLEGRLDAVRHFLPLAAKQAEQDSEYVHQLRVWTRRASAALRLFDDLLPRRRAVWMKKQLKRLRRATNEARDCDVLLARLVGEHAQPLAESLLDETRTRRAAAQLPLVVIYQRLKRKNRVDRRIAKLLHGVRLVDKNTSKADEQRFGDWARARLYPMVESFFEVMPVEGAELTALHHFRIRGKQLRYAMELLAPAFAAEFRQKLYPAVENLQEKLGAINDLAMTQQHLEEQLEAADDSERAAALQKRLPVVRRQVEEARQEFLSWFTPARRQELRAGFESVLGREFPAACK